MNTNNLTAVAIVKEALNLLWDGSGRKRVDSGRRFCCHAVLDAACKLAEVAHWDDVSQEPVVLLVMERIKTHIGGEPVVEVFLKDTDVTDYQEWRKLMLESILAKFVLLERQIEVLEQVKAMREEGRNDSPYVCDNIQVPDYNGRGCALDLCGTPEANAICADIKAYIGGAFSVDRWLEVESHDEAEEARILMIDTLAARYKAALGA